MTKSSLIFKTDPDIGLQIVVKADEIYKSHREDDDDGFSGTGNMFETGTADCPVAALKSTRSNQSFILTSSGCGVTQKTLSTQMTTLGTQRNQ